MNYLKNEDQFCDEGSSKGPCYSPVLDVIFSEESNGDESVIIPLAEVKNFCKIDVDEDDTLLDELQMAAISMCEAATNIGFKERTVTAIIDNRNGGTYLPYGPIGDIALIDTVAPTDGQVEGLKWKQLISPTSDRVEVEYTGGYTVLPYKLKLALLQCIYFLYDERKRREESYPPIYLETLKPFSRND